MHPNSQTSHESISRRAYQIWEETGRVEGSATAHWLQAEREAHAQHAKAAEVDGSRGKQVEPPPTGKHVSEKARHSTDYVHPGITTDALHHVRNH